MVDFWRVVKWWDVWQLRILVMGSLGFQWFLLLAAPMRNYTIPRWFRTCIWLAYITADALAIYALATLFNRHARASSSCDYAANKTSLEVLWAPLLLIYLGGREEITAYNIEDNELWTRHTVTLVSQVTVALYAFSKSWTSHNDRRLLLSAILLFIVGIISFCEKPWSLRRASINRLVAMSSLMKGERKSPTGWQWCFTELDDKYKCWRARRRGNAPILSQGDKVQMMLSDLSLYAAKVTLEIRKKKGSDTEEQQQEILEPLIVGEAKMKPWLRRAFGLIYTRATSSLMKGERKSPTGWQWCFTELDDKYKCWRARRRGNAPILSQGDKVQMMLSDLSLYAAKVTLEIRKSVRAHLHPGLPGMPRPAGPVPVHRCHHALRHEPQARVPQGRCQDNLHSPVLHLGDRCLRLADQREHVLAHVVPGQNPGTVRESPGVQPHRLGAPDHEASHRAAAQVRQAHGLQGRLLPATERQPLPSDFITTELVSISRRVENADFSTYRNFTKGYWTLRPALREICRTRTEIKRSLRSSPFDASVLLWHMATDLCFRCKPPENFNIRPAGAEVVREVCTEAISNYMAYLLHFQPEMLMTGSRQHLFTEATKHMARILAKVDEGSSIRHRLEDKHEKLDDASLEKITEEAAKLANDPPNVRYILIHDACKLAKELMSIEDDDTRWHLMYRVWVGMLCYSASMCRGYLHAKSLGEGGEFLSYVWLIISLTGTKTLADKLQMPEPEAEVPKEEEATTTTTTMPPMNNGEEQEGKPEATTSSTLETEEELAQLFRI
ncbi:unnamed protein product [Urochloa humidicola]